LADLDLLQEKTGIAFHDPSLLRLALVHSSYINENPGASVSSNERLEFVGDAVLGLVIAEELYHNFPESSEGQLTRLRSALVRREVLAAIARRIDLGEYLLLGKGEIAGGGTTRLVNLAGALEAFIASVYFDQGLEIARDFILKLFGPDIYKLAHQGADTDYKSLLQEIVQSRTQLTPSYHVIESSGPDHDRQFTVEVKAGKATLGRGVGKSKKAAEIEAARLALENLSGR
jgi:ribonuclease III